MKQTTFDWLLERNQPSIRYYTLVDLLGRPRNDPEVKQSYSEIPKRGFAHDILKIQKKGGYWESRSNIYLPKYNATNWRMIVLADLGMDKRDRRIKSSCDVFFKEWFNPENSILDDGETCVSGNLARTLTRFGCADDHRVKKLYEWLVRNQKEDGGWHCFKSDKGTLDCWEALAAYVALPRSKWTRGIKKSAERGAEFYLERRLFKEGTRRYEPWFRLHYPIHYYYDILVGMDVVTALGYGGDKRLKDATKLLLRKRRPNGTWLMDTLHPDLGRGSLYRLKHKASPLALEQPGRPSKLITLTALRVLNRLDD
ncbi:MAG: hypothetical protein ACYC7D_12645 [Nitrososphaerales archaeon]